MKSRCLLFLVPLLLVSAVPATAQDTEQPPPVVSSHITDNLHQLLCNGRAGVLASFGKDGTLLVDTGFAATASAVQEELVKLGGGPARIIVNTHGDADHVGGNAVLGEKAVIIAHPYVRLSAGTYFALPAVETAGSPTLTPGGETTLYFNDEIIRVLPIPGGHTAGDMVIHFTKNKVACIGDLVLVGTFPNADPARGGDAQRLVEILKELRKTLPADTTLWAAHGGAITMADLDQYIEMIEGTMAAVAAEIQAGQTLPEIIDRNPLVPWQEWERGDFGLSYENWTTEIHASLAGTRRQSICAPMTEELVTEGVDAAVSRYRLLKTEKPDEWSFAENELNMLGYQLLARDRVDDAIIIFELNVEAFPEGFNTYDSLAEAYMTADRTDEAIANYKRSLELNPDNTNAVAMLDRLRGEK